MGAGLDANVLKASETGILNILSAMETFTLIKKLITLLVINFL